jgi:hypothetical protein
MDRRLELHELLCEALGSRNVYFQPPASKVMVYPCIRYKLYDINNIYADNLVYLQKVGYEIIVIDRDPDSEIVKRVSKISGIRFNRFYTADNLNHSVFVLYY